MPSSTAGRDQGEPALLDRSQQLVGALEGFDLVDEFVELLYPRLAQLVPVRFLYVVAADRRHERVPAHPDARMDAPHRSDDAVAAKGSGLRQGVVVVRVHQGAVDVEDRCVGHVCSLPKAFLFFTELGDPESARPIRDRR